MKRTANSLAALVASLCAIVAFGEDAATGEVVEFSPLNVGEVEQVAGASHSELREVAQASTNYTDAAVAAVKKDVSKSLAAVSNAIPVISATDPAFSNAVLTAVSDELGAKAKRYALVASASASISAADGNLYALTADANGVTVTLPAASATYAQDFVLRVVAADTNGTQIAEISGVNVDLPTGDVFADGSLKGTNYVTFTQTTADTWSIGCFAATKEEE